MSFDTELLHGRLRDLDTALHRQGSDIASIKHLLVGQDRDGRRERQRSKFGKPSDIIVRKALIELRRGEQEDRTTVVNRLYGHDTAVAAILRAAVAPAQTTVSGWAAELVQTSNAPLLDLLAGSAAPSAVSQLVALGAMMLSFDRNGVLKVPGRQYPLVLGGAWVTEASAKPVVK